MNAPDIPDTFRCRRWINDPESLLLSASPVRDLEASADAARFFGLAPSCLLMSRMCTVPLILPELPRPVKDRFADGVRAEALWHPLAWLPASVRDRRTVADDEGSDGNRPEYDDAYAVRIAVTMMGSALFHPENGTWVDVLSLAGIDTDREEDLARVQAWLDGEDDEVLDALDLTPYITSEASELGELLAEEENDLILAGMHRSAWDLTGVIDSAINPATRELADGTDVPEASFALHLAALAAMYSFASLGDPEIGTWRYDASAAEKAETPEAVAGIAERMRARLGEIVRETSGAFKAAVTMLANFDNENPTPAG